MRMYAIAKIGFVFVCVSGIRCVVFGIDNVDGDDFWRWIFLY